MFGKVGDNGLKLCITIRYIGVREYGGVCGLICKDEWCDGLGIHDVSKGRTKEGL